MKTGNTFLEKCLHAFELLGRLQQEGLDFVFKGGTSLLLRIPEPHRLSIDIDIVCRDARLERVLGNCVGTPFTRVEEDKRRHNHPPRRRHWNFHYNSVNPEGAAEPYVILDVLEEDVLYPDVETIPIAASFLEPDHAISVRVPTIDNLLAEHELLSRKSQEFYELVNEIEDSRKVVYDNLKMISVDYIDSQFRHMRYEEASVFPLIEQKLTLNDWKSILQSLPSGDDPLFNENRNSHFDSLYSKLSESFQNSKEQ